MSIKPNNTRETMESPGRNFFNITPHDSTNFTYETRGIYVGGAGNVKILGVGDATAIVFTAVPVGTILPVRAVRVDSTGTTATLLVGIY